MTRRICILTRPDLQPTVHGAAVRIMRTAESLSRLGAAVTLVTNDRLWFYEARDGRIHRCRYPQALLSLMNLPPVVKEALLRHQMPSYWRGLSRVLHRLGYPRDEHFLYQPLIDPDFWLRTLYIGWAHQIEVYQAEFPGYAVPALLAAHLLGGRSALVEHNVEYLRLAETTELSQEVLERLRRIEGFCARSVDHVVAMSEVDRQLLLREGVAPRALEVIPHGVDLEHYRMPQTRKVRARYRLPDDIPLLVFHGTLHYWPNTVAVRHIAEDLLPRLAAKGLDVRVMIIGMNPPRYYAHPQILFTDVVQDLPEHLMAAELAVVPLDDGGGTRLKILEYFAAGLPVVSTPKGAEGIPVVPGETLLLAESMDAFADAVAGLLRHPARARALGEAGRRFVQSYAWDNVCTRYLELYARPLDRPSVGGDPQALRRLASVPLEALWSLARRRFPDPEGAVFTSGSPPASDLPGSESVAGHDGGGGFRSSAADETLPPALVHASAHLPVPLRPTRPLTLILMINRGCNLRCEFCDLYEHPRRLPLEQAQKVIRDAAALGVKTLVLTGGEPFLHPGLWDMIRLARSLGIGTNVTTNGTLIKQHLEALLDSGLDSVSVSVDGLEETHEALRRIKGCHARTLEGLALLARHGVARNIYFVVTGQNVTELVPVYALAKSLGCGFDFWPVNDAHHLRLVTPEHRAAYLDALELLAAREPDVAARRDYYLSGLDYHAGWDRRVRCLGLVEQLAVNLEGELVPCCVWDNRDLRVGSAVDESLSALWYGSAADARRRQIFEQGCHNRCFNHSLYEMQLSTGLSFVVGEGAGP